jgi:hypothetical protein
VESLSLAACVIYTTSVVTRIGENLVQRLLNRYIASAGT